MNRAVFLRCFAFTFIFITATANSQNRVTDSSTAGFASRQQFCLNKFMESKSISSYDRSMAQLFAEKNLQDANLTLSTLQFENINMAVHSH